MHNIDVKSIRKRLRMSQDELAKLIGVSRNTIGNYEKGGVIPESKRELLLKFMNRDVAVEKILGVITTTGDSNISNTGTIKGGASTSTTNDSELNNRIVELEKEIIALKGKLSAKDAENEGLKNINKLLLDTQKSKSLLNDEINKLLGLNKKKK